MGAGPNSTGWQFSLRARGDVKCKFVSFKKFYDLSSKHPAFIADGRAGKEVRRQPRYSKNLALCSISPIVHHRAA